MEKKEMTIEEMQQECVAVAFEIAKMRSIVEKHQKRFNELSYQLWKRQQDEQKPVAEDSK